MGAASTSKEGGEQRMDLLTSLVVGIIAGIIANLLTDYIRARRQ